MLSPKRRNAGERLLSKIPRAVNRICRSHGRRPVLTEHGCAIREDFKTIVLECLYKERHRQHASQSHGPLSADEVSLLIAKCDDLYARDFPAMVESLLRKFVREKNRTISSVLADAHRQLFEKAVTAMKPELAGRNRDETACRKIMWKLFDNANALAAPFLKNLDESSRAPKEYPKLTAYGCAFRDRFCAAAIALRHEAQADALAKSEAGKAAAMKAASPLTGKFDEFYTSFFCEEVDALLGEYVWGAKEWPLEKLFWFAHRPAFRNAIEAIDSHCVEAAWKLHTANRPDLPETLPDDARKMAKGWSPYTALMHECAAGVETQLKSRWDSPDDFPAAGGRLMKEFGPIVQISPETVHGERKLFDLVTTREIAIQTSSAEEAVPTREVGRRGIFRVKHLRTMETQTPMVGSMEYIEALQNQAPARMNESNPAIHDAAAYSSEYMKHFEAFLKTRPDLYDKVRARHEKTLRDAAARNVAIGDYSRQCMKHFEAFLKTRSDICDEVLARRRNILMNIVTRDVGPKRKIEPAHTISAFKSAYVDTFNSLAAGLLANGALSLNALPAVHGDATKVATSMAFQQARLRGEIPIDKIEAFKGELGRICDEIDREIKMRSVLNKRSITMLANSGS